MIEVGRVSPGSPLVAVDAGSAMRLAGSLAALGAVAEAAGWAVSLAVDAADGAISLQVRRVADEVAEVSGEAEVEVEAGADTEVEEPPPPLRGSPPPGGEDLGRGGEAEVRVEARVICGALSPAEGKRRHRGSAERIRQEVWTCLQEDPSTGPELMQLVGASRFQIQRAVNWLAEAGRVTSTGEGWEAVRWRVRG